MKDKFAPTTRIASLGWLFLIAISAGSCISGCISILHSEDTSGVGSRISDIIQNTTIVFERIVNGILCLTDAIYNFLYYDYCDFILGLF